MNILEPRTVYKPFSYPWAFEYFKSQQQAHWLPTEVPLADDVADFDHRLSDEEKNLIIQVLRFFTQGDTEVMNNYNTNLTELFPVPEISMMLSAFAGMEGVHAWAYSYLNDTLGLPEEEYSAFLEYESMKNKVEYLHLYDDPKNIEEVLLNLAVFGGFMEGVSLFSSFAMLMNFPRRGLLKGVGQIVTWSVKDESLHSDGVCHLYREVYAQHEDKINRALHVKKIYEACKEIINLEDKFIDTCFEMGAVAGLTKDQLKEYTRYIADLRLRSLNVSPLYHVKDNPLPWMTQMINGKEHANFFEARATEYAKGNISGDWF
jgi:ribonucleoside-diphosphate reductase beta chain